jgi:uncharacterized protein
MKIKWKIIKKIALILATICLILVALVIHFVLPYIILNPPKQTVTLAPENHFKKFKKLEILTYDSIKLDAYQIFPNEGIPIKSIIIMVHGVGAVKENFFPTCHYYASQGISTIIFDNRAHGKSGGNYATFGYYEKYDIQKIVDLVKIDYPNIRLGILGHSMGGAISTQAMALDKRIEFGVIESSFADLSQIVFDYGERFAKGWSFRFLSNYVLWRAGKIAHFDPNEVKPIEAVKNISQPILFVHGDADKNITCEYSQQLYEACASTKKQLILIPKADHNDLQTVGGEGYQERKLGFLLGD